MSNDTSPAGGNYLGIAKVSRGDKLSASAINRIAEGLNAARTSGGGGASSISTPYGSIVETRRKRFVDRFSFKVTRAGATAVKVSAGMVNDITIAATQYAVAVPSSVYVRCQWASATSGAVDSASIVVLQDAAAVDTELVWFVKLADVATAPAGHLKITQWHRGNILLRRTVHDYSFRSRRDGDLVRVSGGWCLPRHNSSPLPRTALELPDTTFPLTPATLWVRITFDGSAFASAYESRVLGEDYPDATGVYTNLPLIHGASLLSACSTPPIAPLHLLAMPSASDADAINEKGYAVPIADIRPDGTVKQRHLGDIIYDNLAALVLPKSDPPEPCHDLKPVPIGVCVDGQECTMVVIGTAPVCPGGGSDGSDGGSSSPGSSVPVETSGPETSAP